MNATLRSEVLSRLDDEFARGQVFGVINLPCVGVWAGAGAMLRRYLTQPLWRTVFSTVMVLLTIYSAVAIW
eukprot:gene34299-57047_t